jgi:polyisoprenoid-binding protein YceI
LNKKATCVIDTKTGDIQFSVLMKAFEFPKALMEDHFNENYVESHKFPKAVFKGKIINVSDIDWSSNGEYQAKISGKLTMHGVTNEITEEGSFIVGNDKLEGNSKFEIKLSDYDIDIPKVVNDKISEIIDVQINVDYLPYKK